MIIRDITKKDPHPTVVSAVTFDPWPFPGANVETIASYWDGTEILPPDEWYLSRYSNSLVTLSDGRTVIVDNDEFDGFLERFS